LDPYYSEKDWKLELNRQESVICFDLSLKMNPNNEIALSEKEIYEYCGYKSPRYFKRHLESLIDKGIIFKGKESYFFNPLYIEYNEIGPRMYHRPLIKKEVMRELLSRASEGVHNV
jgi:hypothetical protein